ncbi:hypothetical protein VHA01S_024_00520 [Vibrio halioticoli NBRC 102217]|uniref:Uncharacterized protein n=1 Tax=Vibrio halioticoli NBRC 102217 TaxID=1219072 RepID=V5FL92_9VIBR|nr:hypothetical protein VHA01S_024_00520 [Vibrio halioticoli NBRC 102217]
MLDKHLPFLGGASYTHFKSPHGWRLDLIIRFRRLECGVYDSLTIKQVYFLDDKSNKSID